MRIQRFSTTSLHLPEFGIAALIVALSVAALSIQPPQPSVESSAHPSLLQMAKHNPALIVAILVQQRVDDPQLKTMITQHGGLITRSLPIVHGFAARVPAGLIPEIGRMPSVRWISPDNLVLNGYIHPIGGDQPVVGQFQPMAVAVVDTGINSADDLYLRHTPTQRIVAKVRVTTNNNNSTTPE